MHIALSLSLALSSISHSTPNPSHLILLPLSFLSFCCSPWKSTSLSCFDLCQSLPRLPTCKSTQASRDYTRLPFYSDALTISFACSFLTTERHNASNTINLMRLQSLEERGREKKKQVSSSTAFKHSRFGSQRNWLHSNFKLMSSWIIEHVWF